MHSQALYTRATGLGHRWRPRRWPKTVRAAGRAHRHARPSAGRVSVRWPTPSAESPWSSNPSRLLAWRHSNAFSGDRHRSAIKSRWSKPAHDRRRKREEIRGLIKELGDIRHVLSGADPLDKAEVYRHLNLQMTYHPAKRLVRVETSLDPDGWGYGKCPEGVSTTTPTSCDIENCWSSGNSGGVTILVRLCRRWLWVWWGRTGCWIS